MKKLEEMVIINRFREMCISSIDPEQFKFLEDEILPALRRGRNISIGKKAINIILDESRPPNAYFLEIEKDNKEPIRIGERIAYGNGDFVRIRITAEDILCGG